MFDTCFAAKLLQIRGRKYQFGDKALPTKIDSFLMAHTRDIWSTFWALSYNSLIGEQLKTNQDKDHENLIGQTRIGITIRQNNINTQNHLPNSSYLSVAKNNWPKTGQRALWVRVQDSTISTFNLIGFKIYYWYLVHFNTLGSDEPLKTRIAIGCFKLV